MSLATKASGLTSRLLSEPDAERCREAARRIHESGEETGLSRMLAEMVEFAPPIQQPPKSRFEILLAVKEHEMHHRAQLMLVERLLGIVPHLTREREAMMAQMKARTGAAGA